MVKRGRSSANGYNAWMRSISELTPDYLSQALGTLVHDVSAEPVGSGYMADVFRLTLSGPAAPATVILKLPSPDPERLKEARQFDSYRKESFFYRELASGISVSTPACFYNPADRFCLLLEDVGNSRTVDPEDALQSLARLHRSRTPTHGLPGFREGFVAASQLLQQQADRFLKSWPESESKDIAAYYCEHSLTLLTQFEAFPQVLSHMDFRPDNLSMHDGQLIVFDWGEFCLAPPGFDIVSMVVNTCTSDYRRLRECDMIELYAENTDQSPDMIWDSYRLSLLPQIYLPILMLVRGEEAASDALSEKLQDAFSDHAEFLKSRF